jgi:hypothetical protein
MCLGTPGISAVKRALLSAMVNPAAGHPEVPSRLFVAHRLVAEWSGCNLSVTVIAAAGLLLLQNETRLEFPDNRYRQGVH